jgi:hypothetical protein
VEWWGSERRASTASRQLDPELTRLCDVSQALIGAVLSDFSGPSEDLQTWQVAMILATNQAFNSIRSAWGLAFAGYPVQALALVRLAHEYDVLMRFVRENPHEAEEVVAARAQTGELAKALFGNEPQLAAKFQLMRGSLNRFAHQSGLSLNISIRPDDGGETALNLGPFVDRALLRETSYEILVCSTLVIAELMRWLGGQNHRWAIQAMQFSAEATAWLATVRQPAEAT